MPSTVLTLIRIATAISSFDAPAVSIVSSSRSRLVGAAGARRALSMTAAGMASSPAATRRIVRTIVSASLSLDRYPAAPAATRRRVVGLVVVRREDHEPAAAAEPAEELDAVVPAREHHVAQHDLRLERPG